MADENRPGLNIIGELSDRAMEREFVELDIKRRVRFMVLGALVLGLGFAAYSVMALSNLEVIDNQAIFNLAERLTMLFLSILLLILLKFNRLLYATVMPLLVLLEALAMQQTLEIIVEKWPETFMPYIVCTMVFITAFFALPGRWIYTVVLTLGCGIFSLMAATLFFEHVSPLDFWTGYLGVLMILLISGFISLRMHIYRRRQFLVKTEHLRSAMTDSLTGIGNRAKFDTDLSEALSLAMRDVPFCILMLDLDEFETINDKVGTEAGNRLLVGFTELIKGNIRGYESFSRWENKTFCLLLPHTEINDATGLAQRLCRTTAMNSFENSQHLTCCVGVVSYCEGDNSETVMERVIRCKDEAKRLGRNMVVTERELDEDEDK